MNTGKIASSMLVLIITVATTAVWGAILFWPDLAHLSITSRLVGGAVVTLVVLALVLVPFGAILDRSFAGFRQYMESAVRDTNATGYCGPKWLNPIMRSFVGAVDQFRQSEQELRNQLRQVEIKQHVAEAARRQIEAVLHALRDPVIVTDTFNEIVMANEAAADVLGFDLKDTLHQPLERVVGDKHLRQLISDMKETGNLSDRRNVEHELSDPNSPGRKRVFDVTLACVENHKNEPAGVVAILHDLSREREISDMKTEFVSKASHELRTPLTTIRGYLELLVDGDTPGEEERAEAYRIMHNEADRLGRMIDNMLNISRIEAGIVQIDREHVDLRALMERAEKTLEPQARDKRITLNHRPSAVDLCVEGDADMLFQVLLNLGSNAIKYTPEGGRVTVAADSDNLTRSVLVTVSDTGLGIPPDALPHLFEKFYRVKNYERVAKGTGLGLNLCKHIVETVHHGQIGVESELGMGSKFWFSIPMCYVGSQAAA